MNAYRKFTLAIGAVICLASLTPNAHAQLLDEKIRVTFSAPVEVPGRVLPAGTYVFMALEPGHLTRIMSADERTDFGTFLTVPEERREPVEKATVMLGENATGTPERIEAWFYPGNSTGSEFMYRESSSHTRLRSEIDHAVTETAKGALVSTEFVGRESERIVVNSGKAIGHAARYLVS